LRIYSRSVIASVGANGIDLRVHHEPSAHPQIMKMIWLSNVFSHGRGADRGRDFLMSRTRLRV
jgi:hypothetical protein